ncbi:MAG: dCTP deaminase [Candidatus Marsarchaeota archaeon]|jgi:dCTP deaminase
MLSSTEIKELIGSDLDIDPYSEQALGPSGYDLALAFETRIPPLSWTLVSTVERVRLGDSLSAILFIRSSLAREGLIGSFALVDPGFNGNLTISLFNASDKEIRLARGERIVQIAFCALAKPTDRPYSGKYQNSQGVVKSKRGDNVEGPLR